MPVSADTRRILLEAVVISVLGVVLGLSFHYRLVMNAFSGGQAAPAPAATGQAPSDVRFPVPAELDEVRQLMREGAVPVDARAREIYDEGHLPAARSLPLGEVAALLDSFRESVPVDAAIVAYCNGYGCPDSFDLAVRLLAEGYRDVRVFEGGFPEWRDAGLPVEEGMP